MCGIVGFAAPDASREDLERMTARLKHRGPDEQQCFLWGPVGLGFTRLSLLENGPPGRQPISDPTKRWVLAFNGQIYNHLDLRAQLPPQHYRGRGDGETLVNALAAWGLDCLPKLNGMFAFAALDTQAQKLYLVRDRFGVKPLYWTRNERGLYFSNEIRAFKDLDAFPVQGEALRHALVYRWLGGEETMLSGIRRLPPGSVAEWDLQTGDLQFRCWYKPTHELSIPRKSNTQTPREAWQRRLENQLCEAVSLRTHADRPLGALCSGGLDSSLIAAISKQSSELPLYCASIPSQPEFDESHWARIVADSLALDLSLIELTPENWRGIFVPATVHFEYPLVHESSLALALIGQQANKDGIRGLLGGEAADELFGGYPSRHLLEREQYKQGFLDEHFYPSSPMRFLSQDRDRRLEQQWISNTPWPPALKALKLTMGDAGYYKATTPEAYLEAALMVDLSHFLPHGLNRLDKNLMQTSVEFREPFLDPAVVHTALNCPLEYKTQPGIKGILYDIAKKYLPLAICHRPKQGFSFNPMTLIDGLYNPQFLLKGALANLLEMPIQTWQELLHAHSGGRTYFRLLSAEVWLRSFAMGATNQQIEQDLWY